MSNKVITRATCDRCLDTTEFEGAEGAVPPVGWASLSITRRLAGAGWTNAEYPLGRSHFQLCERCTTEVVASIRADLISTGASA